ncbi:hypothetical protein ACWCPG_37920, partial [Streptomyces sp. NPDC001919]
MPARRSVVIGVDSSTQSTKAAAVDAATGELLAVGRAPHTVTGSAGARESDPGEWWSALAAAVRHQVDVAAPDDGPDRPGEEGGVRRGHPQPQHLA